MKRTGSYAGTTAVFLLLGPLVAAIGIFGLFALGAADPAASPGEYRPEASGGLFLLVVMFSYWLGGLSALLTGVVSSIASLWVRSGPVWVGLSVLIGLAVTMAYLFVAQQLLSDPSNSLLESWPLYAGSAVAASLVSALVSLRFRPRRVEDAQP